MKVVDKIKNILGNQKEYIRKYSFTLIGIYITTIIMFFVGFDEELFNKFLMTMIFTSIISFTIESFKVNIKQKIPLYILAFILSLISKEIAFIDNLDGRIILFVLGIYITIFLIGVYKISEKEVFHKYLLKVFNNNLIFLISCIIVQIGLLFIIFIIGELLIDISDLDIYERIEFLFAGIYLTTGELLCLLNVNYSPSKLIKGLVVYIILPLILISEVIIYIYFIKLIVIRGITTNSLFGIISCLFISSIPIWIMIRNYDKENKYLEFNNKYLHLIFIPLIFLQVYALGIRIFDYGFTVSRYLGLILLIFEITSIYLLVKNKEKEIYIVGTILLIIIMCIPKINVIDIPFNSQLNRLKRVYPENVDFDSLSSESKSNAKNYYNYIKRLDMKDKLPEYINQDKLDSYYYNEYTREESKTKYIDFKNSEDEITVTNYDSIKKFHYYNSNYYKNSTNIYTIEDLSKALYNKAVPNKEYNNAYKEKIEKFFKDIIYSDIKRSTLELDNNNKLWIDSYYITIKDDKIENITIEGYILKKKTKENNK